MMNIRRAEAADASAIIECDEHTKTDPSRATKIGAAIARANCLVAVEDEAVIGYCIYNDHFFNHRFVELVVVTTAARRRGAARALLHAVSKDCPTDRIFSSTNSSNQVAQTMFERCDFAAIGALDGFDDGDPEVFYRATKP